MIDEVESEKFEGLPGGDDGPNVKERHIDYLLQEELKVNSVFLRSFIMAAAQSYADTAAQREEPRSLPAFEEPRSLPAFIETARHSGGQIQHVSVKHSVSDNYGEADLIVVYRLESTTENIAILIEDKIHAPFQDGQALRYKKRGEDGEKNFGKWDHHWTCLVAPDCYIKRGHGFDATVELEQIRAWFASNDPGRAEFKVGVVDEAIEKANISGAKIVDSIMSYFRAKHYEAFTDFFKDRQPAPEMHRLQNVYVGESWFKIWCKRLLPNGAYIHHKAPWGFVDLTFPNTDAKRLQAHQDLGMILESDMAIEQTGKSAAIRLLVPPIEDFRCFDDQKISVESAFSAVQRLLDFYAREQSRLEPLLLDARTTAYTKAG